MQTRIPTHSEYHLGLYELGDTFLEKFKDGGLEKLVNKWLDYYFEIRKETQMSKEEFRVFMISEIEFLIKGYSSVEEYLDSDTPIRLMGIYDRYTLLLYDDPNSEESILTIKNANEAVQKTLNALNTSPANGAAGYEALYRAITEDKKEALFENGVIPENKNDWSYYLNNRYREFDAIFDTLQVATEDDQTFKELLEFAISTTRNLYKAIYQGIPLARIFSSEITLSMYLGFMKNHVYHVEKSSEELVPEDIRSQEEVDSMLQRVTGN